MTAIRDSLARYVAVRRALGASFYEPALALGHFVDLLEREGAEFITTDLALRWATTPVLVERATWGRRLSQVRGFARWMNVIDSRNQIPPAGLLTARRRRNAPHIYTEQEIDLLMTQAAQLRSQSMQDEAAKRGHKLVFTDAGGSSAKQASDVNSMIAQGVDAIFLPPREDKALVPVIISARDAGIPVFLIDRDVAHNMAKPGRDYVTFIGSDFVEEGRRVAQWLVKNANGKTRIIEIEGTVGSSPANDRKKGFDDVIKATPGFTIVASQSGDFSRDKGRQVAETLIQAHPDANVIYIHADEMAMGAIAALEAAGKKPGKDVLIVSVDGEKDGVQGIIDGKIGAICGCSPFFGPRAFSVLMDYAAGKQIPPFIKNEDQFYDASNAKMMLASAF